MNFVLLLIFGYGGLQLSSKIINLMRKSATAAALQRLLEHQAQHGFLIGSPVHLAHDYVVDAWKENPSLLNGKRGNRLHKLALVICCLSIAAIKLNTKEDANKDSILLALGTALEEAEVNGPRHPLKAIDREVIAKGFNIYRILESRERFPNENSVSMMD